MNQREIKFRAYNEETKTMLYPDEKDEFWIIRRFSSLKYMLFTGLLDKQGKEIYEGDVVKWGRIKGEVSMKDGCWTMADGWMLGTLVDESKVEVIGNIYQHKNLLK